MFASLTSPHSRLRLESEAAAAIQEPENGSERGEFLAFGWPFGPEVDRAREALPEDFNSSIGCHSAGLRSSPESARRSALCSAWSSASTSRTTRTSSGPRTTPVWASLTS